MKFNNYLIDMKYLPIYRQVRDSYLPDQNRPASTTIAISGLAREGALLEIEAVAVLPAARPRPRQGRAARRAKAARVKAATKASRRKRK